MKQRVKTVKTVSAGQAGKNDEQALSSALGIVPRACERCLRATSLPRRQIPINDLSAVSKGVSLAALIGHNEES
jgi:hypothetical protein